MDSKKLNAQIRRIDETYRERFARRLRKRSIQRADALDAWQYTLLKAADRIRFDGSLPSSEEAWLWTITWRAAIDIQEKQRREDAKRERLARRQVDSAGSRGREALEELTRACTREALDAAISKLTDFQRKVIVRRIFMGNKIVKIAKCLGKSPKAVRNAFQRAVVRLRKLLADFENDLTR